MKNFPSVVWHVFFFYSLLSHFHIRPLSRVSGIKVSCLPQSLLFYSQNPDITHILDNMDVYILPVMNPDGYKYTWTTVIIHKTQLIFHPCTALKKTNKKRDRKRINWTQDLFLFFRSQNRMWRKNRAVSKSSSCIGVDLNRNFDAEWCSECSQATTCPVMQTCLKCRHAIHVKPFWSAL